MNTQNSITVTVTPHIVQDKETGMFSAFFPEIDALSVYDTTEEGAQSRLIALFEAMLQNEPDYIYDTLLRNRFVQVMREKAYSVWQNKKDNSLQYAFS